MYNHLVAHTHTVLCVSADTLEMRRYNFMKQILLVEMYSVLCENRYNEPHTYFVPKTLCVTLICSDNIAILTLGFFSGNIFIFPLLLKYYRIYLFQSLFIQNENLYCNKISFLIKRKFLLFERFCVQNV